MTLLLIILLFISIIFNSAFILILFRAFKKFKALKMEIKMLKSIIDRKNSNASN